MLQASASRHWTSYATTAAAIRSLPLEPGRLARGEDRGQVVARMRRLLREIGVVEVEVAEQDAVDEGRHVGAGAAAVERGGGRLGRNPRRHPLGYPWRVGSIGAPSAQPSASISRRFVSVYDQVRQILEPRRDRVFGKALRKCLRHSASGSAAECGR